MRVDPGLNPKGVMTFPVFRTVQTPLLRGPVFSVRDTAESAPVAIINQTTANRYFPGQDPIGKRVANSRDRIQREIVGVVADVKVSNLGAPPVEELYLHWLKFPGFRPPCWSAQRPIRSPWWPPSTARFPR